MKIICSKTGSDGNFSLISDGQSSIAIDCGIRWEKANKMSGYTLMDAVALLITHNHWDHVSQIRKYIPKMLNVICGDEVFYDGEITSEIENVYGDNIHTIDGSQITVGTFIVKPFKVPHTNSDGSPCENYGFLIYSKVTKEKMLWITDCSYIENKFPPVDYICVECNYIDVDDYSKELDYINPAVEKRRFSSHLSLNRCVDFIKKQDLSKVKFIKLLHLTKNQGIIEDEIKSRFAKEFPEIEVIV